MATVNLKIKDEQGSVKTVPYEIEALDGFKFEAVMKVVKSVMQELQQDESLKGLFKDIFGEDDVRDIDISKLNTDILTKAVNSFETIFVTMPGKAYELLSVFSGIDLHTLKSQKFDETLNIYDAVLEENEVEKLINRIKKSLALTKTKMKFTALVMKATRPVMQT